MHNKLPFVDNSCIRCACTHTHNTLPVVQNTYVCVCTYTHYAHDITYSAEYIHVHTIHAHPHTRTLHYTWWSVMIEYDDRVCRVHVCAWSSTSYRRVLTLQLPHGLFWHECTKEPPVSSKSNMLFNSEWKVQIKQKWGIGVELPLPKSVWGGVCVHVNVHDIISCAEYMHTRRTVHAHTRILCFWHAYAHSG